MTNEEKAAVVNGIHWGGSGMTIEAWNWIVNTYPEGSTILEFGSGHVSTPVLSTRYNLHTVEHDKKYLDIYPNAKYIHAPMKNSGWGFYWYDENGITEKLPSRIDLVIVDGPPQSVKLDDGSMGNAERDTFIDYYKRVLHKHCNADTGFMVDDVYRPEVLCFAYELQNQLKTHQLTIPKEQQFAVLIPE